MNAIKSMLNKAICYMPSLKKRVRASIAIVYIYGIGLVIIFLMFISAWMFDFYRTGHADIQQLITFFKEFTAPAVVGAFTFVSVFCVDKNNDGRSDAAEKEAENAENKEHLQ